MKISLAFAVAAVAIAASLLNEATSQSPPAEAPDAATPAGGPLEAAPAAPEAAPVITPPTAAAQGLTPAVRPPATVPAPAVSPYRPAQPTLAVGGAQPGFWPATAAVGQPGVGVTSGQATSYPHVAPEPYTAPMSNALRKLSSELDKHEHRSLELAQDYRSAQDAPESADREKRLEVLKQQLKSTVAVAFKLRQQVYEQRAKELEEHLNKVEQAIERRNEAQDAIINRRVSELMGGEVDALDWDPGLTKGRAGNANGPGQLPPQVMHVPPVNVPRYAPSTSVSRPGDPTPIQPAGPAMLPGGLNDDQDLAAMAARNNLQAARSGIAQLEGEVERLQQLAERGVISPGEFRISQLRLDAHRQQLAETERQIELLRKLRKLDIEQAEAALQVAAGELSTAVELSARAPDAVSDSEISKLKLAVKRAELGLERAKARLELLGEPASADPAAK